MTTLENLNGTTEPFAVGLGHYKVSVAAEAWNGGSVVLERSTDRAWLLISAFTGSGSIEYDVPPSAAGLHRLRVEYGGDVEGAIDAAQKFSGRLAAYGGIVNDPIARQHAADMSRHLDVAVAAMRAGQPVLDPATMAEASALFAGGETPDEITKAYVERAVAAIAAMQALKAPVGVKIEVA